MRTKAGFELLVTPCLFDLHRYCCHLAHSKWDGDDLYQDVLLKSYAYYLSEGEIKEPLPFLYRVARNLWIDHYRKLVKMPISADCDYSARAYWESDYFDIQEIMERLARHMTARYVNMWLLADYFGYTMTEIAERFNCTVSVVKNVLFRAREIIHHLKRQELNRLRTHRVVHTQLDRWVQAVMTNQPQMIG